MPDKGGISSLKGIDRDDLIFVATVVKPHGLKGILKVKVESDNPKRFLPGEVLLLVLSNRMLEVTIEHFVPQNQYGLLKLEEIDSMEQADPWREAGLAVPSSKLIPLESGNYYTFQLLGLSVISEQGEELGLLSQIEEYPAGDIYLVKGSRGQFYIPAKGDIIQSIDLERKVITIKDMEGLR